MNKQENIIEQYSEPVTFDDGSGGDAINIFHLPDIIALCQPTATIAYPYLPKITPEILELLDDTCLIEDIDGAPQWTQEAVDFVACLPISI